MSCNEAEGDEFNEQEKLRQWYHWAGSKDRDGTLEPEENLSNSRDKRDACKLRPDSHDVAKHGERYSHYLPFSIPQAQERTPT